MPQFHRRQSRHQMLLHKQTRRRSKSRSGGRQLTPDTGTQMVPVNFVSPSTRCRRHGRPAGRGLFRFFGQRYFFSIGGPIFSAGAGGNAAFAPCRSASGAGRAGSGAGLVGRVPPGFDSAGLLSFCETAPCSGALEASVFCCPPCAAAIKAPDTTITVAIVN